MQQQGSGRRGKRRAGADLSRLEALLIEWKRAYLSVEQWIIVERSLVKHLADARDAIVAARRRESEAAESVDAYMGSIQTKAEWTQAQKMLKEAIADVQQTILEEDVIAIDYKVS